MNATTCVLACLALASQARKMQPREIESNTQPCQWLIEPKPNLVVLLMNSDEDFEQCMLEGALAGIDMTPLKPCENLSQGPKESLATLLLASNPALAPRKAAVRSRVRSSPKMSTGLYYSTSTGNTETVAEYIANAAGVEDWKDIADAEDGEVAGHDSIIVGAPTWHTGADSERSGTSWDEWLYDTLPNLDLTGKKVAIFGVGDSSGYGDNYCDATGELYDCFTGKGAKVFGATPSDTGFDYTESKGVVDGKFVGVVFDEDNYGDESEARANAWVDQLKSEGFM
jgi:flavodoxin I